MGPQKRCQRGQPARSLARCSNNTEKSHGAQRNSCPNWYRTYVGLISGRRCISIEGVKLGNPGFLEMLGDAWQGGGRPGQGVAASKQLWLCGSSPAGV